MIISATRALGSREKATQELGAIGAYLAVLGRLGSSCLASDGLYDSMSSLLFPLAYGIWYDIIWVIVKIMVPFWVP